MLDFDRPNESALLLALTDAIQNATINSWGWIKIAPEWEESTKDSLDDAFKRKLYKILDEGGLQSLLKDFIKIEIILTNALLPESKANVPSKDVPLSEYPRFSDALSVAREVLVEIKKLPKQYIVIAPAIFYDSDNFPADFEMRFSDRLSLLSRSRLPDGFQFECENKRMDDHVRKFRSKNQGDTLVNEKGIFFVYRTSGLVSDRNRPSCFIDFYDDIRAFYGGCMALGILNYSYIFRTGKSYPVHGNSLIDGNYNLEIVEGLEEDLQDLTECFFSTETEKTIQGGTSIEEILKPIKKLFVSAESQRLRTSSIWLFRSYHAERGMDRILDSTIAMEVLLGDREAGDRVGLSKLMANRCAYALGKSAKDRSELYKFFLDFYRLRSEIVHSGRLKISEEENVTVEKGLALASRMLRHEVRMN